MNGYLPSHSPAENALEREPQRELPDTRRRASERTSGCDLTEVWAIDVRGAVGYCGLRKLGMIQCVEKLGAKFEFVALRERSRLGQCNVEVGKRWTAQPVTQQPVGSIFRIIHRIKLRETGIGRASIVIIIILQGHIGEAIGIKDKVPRNSLGRNLAAPRDGVGTVGNFIDRTLVTRIKSSDRLNHGDVCKTWIARARSPRVTWVSSVG